MNKVKILSDSTCDLSDELIKRYDIGVIPLCIVLGEDSYYDGVNITTEEIFKWSDEHKTTPKTAAISFDETLEALKPYMDEGYDIIFFTVSSKLSTTYNVVRLVAEQEEYKRLFIIDSQNICTGVGIQVIKAAMLANEGKSAEEIVTYIEGAQDRVDITFVVDNLTFLARGGRCTTITAVMANTLKLHPLLTLHEGVIEAGKKYRGKIESVISDYINDLTPRLTTAEPEIAFITHSGCPDEIVNSVYDKLKALNYFKEIHITRAGGIISSHCGPNTFGVVFYRK